MSVSSTKKLQKRIGDLLRVADRDIVGTTLDGNEFGVRYVCLDLCGVAVWDDPIAGTLYV